MNDMVFRLGGEGGEGVISTGELLTVALARAGYEIYTFRTYPAEIKGGHANFQVRASNANILLSQGTLADVLVAFNQEAYDKHVHDVSSDGVIIYDTDSFQVNGVTKPIHYGIPLTTIAVEEIGLKLTKNMVALGALAGLFNLPRDRMEEVVRDRFMKKGEAVAQKNVEAIRAGFSHVQQKIKKIDRFRLEPAAQRPEGDLVMSGNESLALGALMAGCRLYAGYPITPATDIMEFLAEELPKFGGTVIQTEDEIAALSAVLGASYGGVKAMTATSGPGFSLMIELLGLASMAEVPAVIVDVQRAGPSTGMPTKTEQGDLNFAIFGGHGNCPRVVIALTSVRDCFYGMIHAFNIAEQYQVPVVVLSDQQLGHRKATLSKPDLSQIRIASRREPTPEELKAYRRYRVTEDGVSPIARPGTPDGHFIATGLEHDEFGMPSGDPTNHYTMVAKRARKLDPVEALASTLVQRYGVDDPIVGVLGWGSTEGVIREAVEMAVATGYKVAALHPKIVWPMPEQALRQFAKPLKRLIIPETNFGGQYAQLVHDVVDVKLVQLNKCNGLPFTPQEIFNKIEEVVASV